MYKVFFAILGILALPIAASASPAVLINEINWMGSTTSANHEWIELYNPGSESIDLTGWQLIALDGTPSINLSGAIAGGEYYLLERTNDDSAPGVTADLIYTGALGNTGEDLILKDAEGNTIDSVLQSDGWLAGDNITKQTMERVNLNTWATSLIVGGTPKAENSTATQPEETDNETDENDESNNEEENQEENNDGNTDEESNDTEDEDNQDESSDNNDDQTNEDSTDNQPTKCQQRVTMIEQKINRQLPDVICERINTHQEKVKNKLQSLLSNLKSKLAVKIKK